MDCDQPVGMSEDDTEIAYIHEGDTSEVIDISESDTPDALESLDVLDLAENDVDGMDEESAVVERDDARVVFRNHSNSVLCVNVDPKCSQLAVSGGQDDVAYVWQLTDGNVCFECLAVKLATVHMQVQQVVWRLLNEVEPRSKRSILEWVTDSGMRPPPSHRDSVHCVGFSHDSVYVVTGDMKGVIKIWRVESKLEVFSFALPIDESAAATAEEEGEEEEEDLMWLQWHAKKYDLLAGTKTGEIYLWTDVPASSSFRILPGHGYPCTIGCYTPDGQLACAGYEDGTVKVWNLSTGNCVQTFAAGKLGHSARVTCITCHQNSMILLTGSTDLTALLLNVKSGKVLTKFVCGDTNNAEGDSLEAVGISSCSRYLATGTNFGVLTIWEADRYAQRHQCKHETGVTKLCWDTKAPIVYTATQGGSVFAWDARNGSNISTWQGHSDTILDICLSRDNNMLVTSSDDGTARVFSARQ